MPAGSGGQRATLLGMTSDDPSTSPYAPDRAWAEAYPEGGYFVEHRLNGHPAFEFLLAGLNRNLTMASPRPFRHGGYAPSDRAMQQQLFLIVGAITVAGAQAETDMKRILLAHDPDTTKHYSDTKQRWSDLMKELRALAAAEDGPVDLQELLGWADEQNVEEVRNGAVHSYWWLFDVGHVHRARIQPREEDVVVLGTWDDYFRHVSIMFEFAARLQAIVPWPTAILPPLNDAGMVNEPVRLPLPPDLMATVQMPDSPTG